MKNNVQATGTSGSQSIGVAAENSRVPMFLWGSFDMLQLPLQPLRSRSWPFHPWAFLAVSSFSIRRSRQISWMRRNLACPVSSLSLPSNCIQIKPCVDPLPRKTLSSVISPAKPGSTVSTSAMIFEALRQELNRQLRWGEQSDVKIPDIRRIFYLLALGIKNCNLEEGMATRAVFSSVPMHNKCKNDLQLFLALYIYMAMGHSHNLPTWTCS